MEMAVKTVERGSAVAQGGDGAGGAGNSFPLRRQAWGAPPLSLPPSWLLGSPPPWRWDPWGRQKRGFGGCKFVGGGVLHDLGFPPLYRLSDFRHPLWTFSKSGFSPPSGLRLGRILPLELLGENSLKLSRLDFFHLTSSSVHNGSIFEYSFQTDFRKVPIRLQQGFLLYF